MDVSVGVMAYNEGNDIAGLLRALGAQKTQSVRISEIIVVSSGSTDATDDIVRGFAQEDHRIRLVRQQRRMGKASAINVFLKRARSRILVMIGADTVPSRTAIEMVCKPLTDKRVGIVGGRPIPTNSADTVVGYAVNLQWRLHHLISSIRPKFGELIAFRKAFEKLPITAVDEEQISQLIAAQGYRGTYAASAIVRNRGPATVGDFLRQRRRIYCGHLQLKHDTGYEASTMSSWRIAWLAASVVRPREAYLAVVAASLEAMARVLGLYDCCTQRKHHIWQIAESAKR